MSQRPLPVTVAAVIQVLFSLLSLPGPLLPGSEQIPAVVVYGGIVPGVAGLVASAGLWMLKKWAMAHRYHQRAWRPVCGPGGIRCAERRTARCSHSRGSRLRSRCCAGSTSFFAACSGDCGPTFARKVSRTFRQLVVSRDTQLFAFPGMSVAGDPVFREGHLSKVR